jgi:hypothetical protein
MKQSVQTVFRIIEEFWQTIQQNGIPSAMLRDQLPSATLPPASGTARGGVLLSDANPAADGTADPGTSSAASRADHVHPSGGGGLPALTEGDLITADSGGNAVTLPLGTTGYMLYAGSTAPIWDVPPPPSGVATGDLDGSYPAPIVDGIQGRPIVSTAPNDGDVYAYNTGSGFWEPVAQSGGMIDPTTTTGDLIVNDGSGVDRLPVGTDTYVLTADSGEALGVKWAALPSGAYATDVGDGVSTAIVVTHSLGTRDVLVEIRETASPYELVGLATIEATSTNTITVTFGSAPTTNQYRVIVSTGTSGGGGGGGGGNVTSTGAVGSEPGTPTAGDLYLPNNGGVIERYSGSAWAPWGPIFPLTDPTLQSWSWVNQGGASVDTSKGGIYLLAPASGSMSMRIRAKAVPTAPYVIDVLWQPLIYPDTYGLVSLGWRNSTTGELVHVRYGWTSPWQLAYIYSNSATADNSAVVSTPFYRNAPLFIRLQDDNTNRKAWYSEDGQHWLLYYSESRTAFTTPDQVFFGSDSRHASHDCGVGILSWKEA